MTSAVNFILKTYYSSYPAEQECVGSSEKHIYIVKNLTGGAACSVTAMREILVAACRAFNESEFLLVAGGTESCFLSFREERCFFTCFPLAPCVASAVAIFKNRTAYRTGLIIGTGVLLAWLVTERIKFFGLVNIGANFAFADPLAGSNTRRLYRCYPNLAAVSQGGNFLLRYHR